MRKVDPPICKGFSRGAPKGDRQCRAFAMPGCDFCWAHEPKMAPCRERAHLVRRHNMKMRRANWNEEVPAA